MVQELSYFYGYIHHNLNKPELKDIKMVRFLTMFLAAAMIIPTFANAQDEGLYDPVAPDGSAFFRFINADSNKGDNETKAGKKSLRQCKIPKN